MESNNAGRIPTDRERMPADTVEGNGAELGMEALLQEEDYNFRRLRRGETVEGTVVRVDPDEVLVDIGMKSEGTIRGRELYGEDEQPGEPLQVGQRTLVYVIHPEGYEGHPILSLRRAQMERSWREIEEAYNEGEVIEAPIVDFNKGGLIADVKGVRGFIPVSQVLDLRNVGRQDGDSEEVTQALIGMRGRNLPVKVIEINRSRNRLILSERAAMQEQRTQRKDELLEDLEPGQIRKGVVSNLTVFGAFIDLGGADGLVHVSELSYNRVNDPGEIVQVGQEVEVYVLSLDKETQKIALSLKRAQPDPWARVDERYHLGQVVPATITKLQKFGAFAKVDDGLEGLIHLSELTDQPIQDPAEAVQEGQRVDVKIIHIQSDRRRLGLSVRQAMVRQPQVESFGEAESDTVLPADFGTGEMPEAVQDTAEALSSESMSEEPQQSEDSSESSTEPEGNAPIETNEEPPPTMSPSEEAPASMESSSESDEEPQPEVASTAPQGSPSE